MKIMRKIGFFSLLLVAVQFAQNAGATPVSGAPYHDCRDMFDAGSGPAAADCRVYKDTSDLLMNACQISNQDFATGISFFSTGMSEGVSVSPASIESDSIRRHVDPVFWTAVGSPVQSVEFPFADAADGGEQSVLLWFAGDRKTISGQRYVVRRQCLHAGRFTYTDTGASSIRIAWHDWSMGF